MATSPNMQLPIPVVGVTSGTQYATDIDSSLTIIDGHDHSSGNGVQITPSGLNINSDLPLNGSNLTLAKSVNFQAQASPLTGAAPDLGCLYVSGVDLYYNDKSGNQIRITQAAAVAGSAGTITGLPSGTASASYGAGAFVFQSATNTAANIDGASFLLRNSTASSHALTLSPPNAMGADYGLFLPAIPLQTNVMTLDASGNMGSITYDAVGQAMTSVGANAIGVSMTSTGANAVANSRTRATGTSVGLGGVAISSSSGNFSTVSTTLVDVTNLTVTIITSGKPVELKLIPDGTTTPAAISTSDFSGTGNDVSTYVILRDSSIISEATLATSIGGSPALTVATPPGSVSFTDVVGAGTYVYKVQCKSGQATTTTAARQCKLVAYEL